MNKALVAILSLVVGMVLGYMGSAAMIGGAAGAGIAVGLSSGICAVTRAAEEEGLLTTDQIDQVMQRAATDLAELSGNTAEGEISNTSESCDAVFEKLRAGQE
ncbi:hypothetical protein R5H30_01125 [Sulfitobacter sp. D35]|uniref:hypothetical protein n=1 Tax=Sulfitobacter sp. D35 TaxID=3083252 RepID=UPI00296FF232|nr:hypothetical protein [Sulfitobacter sp. D35]MDW4496566.1 hypothetical protein [Sulfitobacter sp. D35]